MPPISSHGGSLEWQRTPGGAFFEIGEVMDVTGMDESRNEFDVTPHNRNIDSYIRSAILRRTPLQFVINYMADDTDHQGLRDAMYDNTTTGFRRTYPDGEDIIFSGGLTNVTKPMPVDGALQSTITIRPSGLMAVNGEVVGS